MWLDSLVFSLVFLGRHTVDVRQISLAPDIYKVRMLDDDWVKTICQNMERHQSTCKTIIPCLIGKIQIFREASCTSQDQPWVNLIKSQKIFFSGEAHKNIAVPTFYNVTLHWGPDSWIFFVDRINLFLSHYYMYDAKILEKCSENRIQNYVHCAICFTLVTSCHVFDSWFYGYFIQ